MPSPRHRREVVHPLRRRTLQLALPAGVLSAVAVTGVLTSAWAPSSSTASASSASASSAGRASGGDQVVAQPPQAAQLARTVPVGGGSDSPYELERLSSISRSTDRVTLHKKPAVKDRKYRTADLNLWRTPQEKGRPLTVLDEGGKVADTGVRKNGFAQILHDGQVRWVNAKYLADKKPVAATAASGSSAGSSAGVSSAPCPDDSGTEAGLTPSAVQLFRSVCNAFPALTTYGGYDGHGEHSSGRAIDFMISDPSLGNAVADWARAHASELNLFDVIWQQRIWTPVRSGEGWRGMPDRGSPTANHFDHVHISVN